MPAHLLELEHRQEAELVVLPLDKLQDMVQQMVVLAQAQGLEAADWQQPVILRLLRVVLERILGLVLAEGREEATGLPPQSL